MSDNFDYRDIVEEIFQDRGIKFDRNEDDDHAIFAIPMSVKNVPVLRIFFDVSEIGDCKIRSFLVRDLPKNKFPAMIETLNKLNSQYRYITLSLDSDGDVMAAYDFTLFSKDPDVLNQNVMTIFMLVCQIMDKCVKHVMRITLLDDDDED